MSFPQLPEVNMPKTRRDPQSIITGSLVLAAAAPAAATTLIGDWKLKGG